MRLVILCLTFGLLLMYLLNAAVIYGNAQLGF